MNNNIELMDYGRESAELNYAHMIQLFHRFLIDHLSSEGNSFPHNPSLLPNAGPADLLSPAPAPITQLLGIDAKNIIVCTSCHAVREKENMTHLVDMTYPVRKAASNDPAQETDFASLVRASLLRQTTHKATCQTCKQFATFESRRSICSRDLPPLLAVNAAVHGEETHKFWRDQRKRTFLRPKIELRGQIEGLDDPETVVYELRAMVAQIVAKDAHSHLVAIVKGKHRKSFPMENMVLNGGRSARGRGIGSGAMVHLQRLRSAEHYRGGGSEHSVQLEGKS